MRHARQDISCTFVGGRLLCRSVVDRGFGRHWICVEREAVSKRPKRHTGLARPRFQQPSSRPARTARGTWFHRRPHEFDYSTSNGALRCGRCTRSQQPVFSADAGVAGELRERHIAAAAGHATQILFLIPSQLVLSGLEDGSLELSSRPYEFSLRNSQTGQIQNWRSANGPAQFKLPNAASLSRFQIGLAFGNAGVEWTGEYERSTGSCYWVNSFLPAQLYSSFPGRSLSTMSKSFPSPAQTLRCANRACERDGDS